MPGDAVPLVTISIPTKDSAATLRRTLESLAAQTSQDFETVVVDGESRDDTPRIAAEFGCRVVSDPGRLLAARVRGIREARGSFILLLDSDQVMAPTTLDRALSLMNEYDMLLLVERPLDVSGATGRLFDAGRALVQADPTRYAVPESGLVMPRFFRASLLKAAAERIPREALGFVTDRDHQILFYECARLSRRLGIVPDALAHIEPATLLEVLRRAGRWGYGAGRLKASRLYDQLFSHLMGVRVPSQGVREPGEADRFLRANLLAAVKAIPYSAGFAWGWLDQRRRSRGLGGRSP